MTDSDRILAQHNEAAEPSVDLPIEHPTSVGIGAMSGGLAGAVLGSMVAGRLGAAMGALVGGVVGATISNEKGEEISHAVENAVGTAKQKAQEAKPSVMGTLDQVESKASTVNPNVSNAVNTFKAKIDNATPDADSSDANSSAYRDANAQSFDPQRSMSAPSIDSPTEYTTGYATADDIYSAGNLDATSAYVEDTSLESTVNSMTAAPGYSSGYTDATTGYASTSAGYGVDDDVADMVADDVYSPEQINSSSAYIEEQPSGYESMSSTGYASSAAYALDNRDGISVSQQYDQGVELGKQGDLAGAIAAFQSVVTQEPDYAEAHYNLGVVLCKYGLAEQGITHIQQSRMICQSQGRTKEAENIDRILRSLDIQ